MVAATAGCWRQVGATEAANGIVGTFQKKSLKMIGAREATLNALIQIFLDICRLRRGPQDVPASWFLFGLTAAAYFVTGVIDMSAELGWPDTLVATLLDMALMSGLLYMVLWIKLTTVRWQQTMTAFYGAGALLGLAMMPLVFWYEAAGPNTAGAVLPSLLLLAILMWQMFIIANILRHALEVPLIMGGVFAALYLFINLRILNALFFQAE